MKKPTRRQVMKLRSLMKQMGIPEEIVHARVSEYIASGIWDRETVGGVVIPMLERKVEVVRHISDLSKRKALFSRLREDVVVTARTVVGRDIVVDLEEEKKKAESIELKGVEK